MGWGMRAKQLEIEEVPVDLIEDNPYQMRESYEKEPLSALIKSIRERGLFNPINVLKKDNRYIVISGHRRLRAYRKLKHKTIPAIIKERAGNSLVIDLCHENLIREDLTPVEKALAIKLLISQIEHTKNDTDKMMTLIGILKNLKKRGYIPEHRKEQTKDFTDDDVYNLDKLLKSINVSENNAITYLSILNLPKDIKNALCFNKKGKEFTEKISVKKAEQLARIKDEGFQKYAFRRACYPKTTARHIQSLADMYVKKVLSGEWEGFEKKKADANLRDNFKDDLETLNKLIESSDKLSANLQSFRVSSLLKLEGTIEKTLFISSMLGLKKELDTLRNRVVEKLKEKGYSKVDEDIDSFKVILSPMNEKNMLRFTFPAEIRKAANISLDKRTAIELKLIGVKEI
jgi:hypothetical protein